MVYKFDYYEVSCVCYVDMKEKHILYK